jgi:hypothetical protein
MKKEEHRQECPHVISREWPSAVKHIKENVFFDFPRGQIGRPPVLALDLNFEVRPQIRGYNNGKNVEDHGFRNRVILTDEHSIDTRWPV